MISAKPFFSSLSLNLYIYFFYGAERNRRHRLVLKQMGARTGEEMGSDRSSRAGDMEWGGGGGGTGVEVARGAQSSRVGHRVCVCVTHREADRRRECRHTLSGRFLPSFLPSSLRRSRRGREDSRRSRAHTRELAGFQLGCSQGGGGSASETSSSADRPE